MPNPYQTRSKPVLTRSIPKETPGICTYPGFSKPVPNPYQTRTLPVLTRTKSMCLGGSDYIVFLLRCKMFF